MKILLIGNGAREHCIAQALTKNGGVELATFAKSKNSGIFKHSSAYELGSYKDFSAITAFAKKVQPDFAFIGPDDPIADGVADLLLELGIASVAPLKTVARLESSKSFARDLVTKYNIPGNPKFKIFYEIAGVRTFLEELGGDFVVKADGLMGGKGVQLSGDHLPSIEAGEQYAKECIEKFGRVVIEEKLVGQEFSLMSFVDGRHVVDMPPIQDHKRAFEDDKGPNTGGMGSYSDSDHRLPFLTVQDLAQAHEINQKVVDAVEKETGTAYRGILYGGFMAVKDGIRLIEYNARFGDPEVMNVLPLLQNDFVDVCKAILAGTLDQMKISFSPLATVCKYIVPEGYPDTPKAGMEIHVDQTSLSPGVQLYYSSVDQRDDTLFTSSSRAIAVLAQAQTLEAAEKLAEKSCNAVTGPVFHRRDIGTAALIAKRVEMINQLRA